jgi:hypothetical protein
MAPNSKPAEEAAANFKNTAIMILIHRCNLQHTYITKTGIHILWRRGGHSETRSLKWIMLRPLLQQ